MRDLRELTKRELRITAPEWWKPEGAELDVKRVGVDYVYLASRATRVRIRHIPVEDRKLDFAWMCRVVTFSNPLQDVTLRIPMNTEHLEGIFCEKVIGPDPILAEFNATSGVEGTFIRRDEFACIPGPSRRLWGEANFSILVNSEMKGVIEHLIKKCGED